MARKSLRKKDPSRDGGESPEKPNPDIRPAADDHDEERLHFPIVGFGASAGGLEAFTDVLQGLRADAGIALILVMHLDPKHASMLTDLLARATPIPVVQVSDGMLVEPNRVYVIPPNSNLLISRGILHLEPRPLIGQHLPIDIFFRSLAQDQGSRAIGVILSGSASDGTLGLKAIKLEGGITIAQQPESAKYDGMPRSAISGGAVDFVLQPAGIARELVSLSKHPYMNGQRPGPEEVDEEAAFRDVFTLMRSTTGVDFNLYKPGTVRRRTLRRMALQKLDTISDYAKFVKENRAELNALFQDILINVTGFFREAATFDAIKSRVLPHVFQQRSPEDPVRVWVPGCSTGEEVYSTAIVILEYMRETGVETPLQIFGTDLSDAALEKARAGCYSESISIDVTPERLRRFFVRENGNYQISRSVRDACVFARQNVTKDPPFSRLDLIVCRNLLIYLGPALQTSVFRLFHYALKSRGYMVLGNSESVGAGAELFEPIDKTLKIYTRKPGTVQVSEVFGIHEDVQPGQLLHPPEPVKGQSVQQKVDQILLSRYSAPAVVVDGQLRVCEFRGQTASFLEHPPGEATLDLLKLAPGSLGTEIRKLVRKAELRGAPVRSELHPVALKDRIHNVRVSVSPVQSERRGRPQFLVVFEEAADTAAAQAAEKGKPPRGASAKRINELEGELESTREYLQTLIEEQEAATEELKSAHEEVQSANEELQSTNEELLTAKEELQSTNEELTTVNEEMQSRNTELQLANNDLLNLLSSVNIPIVMLGNDLRIRRFTPQAEKLLNLLPTDAGRPISDFRLKISLPDLASMCQDVIDTLVAKEREVQDGDSRTYSMWIRPYRTADNKIDGVVLALFDVTERRRSAEARYRRLFEASVDGIVIADAGSGEILDANPQVTKTFGHPRGELVGSRFWESPLFANSPVDDTVLARVRDGESFQVPASLLAPDGERAETEIVCNLYEEGSRKVVQFNIRDVTARKRVEDQVRRQEAQTQQAQKMEAVGRLAGGVAHDFNNLLTAILGYCDLLETEMQDAGSEPALVVQIRGAAEKASLLTKQLLAFGRKQVAQPKELALNEVVREIEQLVSVMLPANIDLQLRLDPDTGRVLADRGQLEQVALNLVLNARDAMPNGGRITISTANFDADQAYADKHPTVPPGEYVTLTVSDTGTGMDAETQARMFEPFFTTKPVGKGAGLGLSTTYRIVRDSGGFISAVSELGVGTTFCIYLLRIAAPAAAERPASPAEIPGGTETVLLVEDEPAVRHVTRRFLEQRGYRVIEASNPRDALRMSKEFTDKFDLLLTDVVMPYMSGRELAFLMARQRPETKVLFMSGHDQDTISQHGVLEPDVKFLQKPFSAAALALAVRDALDGSAPES